MKFTVGILLTGFGTFWGAEGAGAEWPHGDTSLPVVVAGVAVLAIGLVVLLRRTSRPKRTEAPQASIAGAGS
jgi:uncharacterized membrane protein